MRIVVIPSWYTSKSDHINGSFFKEQAIALARYGYEVIVLNVAFRGRNDYFDRDNFHLRVEEYDGIKEYAFSIPGFGVWRLPNLASRLFSMLAKKVMRSIILNEGHVDVIHVHSFFPAGRAAVQISNKYDIPLVYTEHSSGILMGMLTKREKKLLSNCLSHSDASIAVSKNLANSICKTVAVKKEIKIIPNMVSERFFDMHERSNNKRFAFTSVARLDKNKRIELILRATALLQESGIEFIVKIIGDGPEREYLETLCKRLGIEKTVHFFGQCERSIVVKEMKSSDAFILLSRVETFGIVFAEAIACGLPVIAPKEIADNLGLPEDLGYYVNVSDPVSVSDAMKSLMLDIKKYDRQKIGQYGFDHYSEKSVCGEIGKVYEMVRR